MTGMTTSSVKNKPIKIASFHDIHLGHNKTPASFIVNNLHNVLDQQEEVSTWDMMIIPGDLFDKLLYLTFAELEQVFLFFVRALKLAKKHDFIIRILEGTPGHDYKQSHLFSIVNNLLKASENLQVDFKHVTELSIEYIPRFDINILYVPDEWNTDVVETYNQAVDLIQSRGLTKVDYCLLHGAFNYQIDVKLNPKAHSEELWCNLVNYYIFAGHVHFKSQYKNILVAGSFDRLAHGEEQPKGWLTCEVKENGEHEIIFHENKSAMIYKTIDIRDMDTEEALKKVESIVSALPDYSHVRLLGKSRDVIMEGLKTLKQRFSYIQFTVKIDKKDIEKEKKSIKLVAQTFKSIDLDKDNILRIVSERVQTLPEVNTAFVIEQLTKYI